MQVAPGGLEGVVVADTVMSRIDGQAGRLLIRGHDVEQLTEIAGFEDVCGLLLSGAEPGDNAGLRRQLGVARIHAHARIGPLGRALHLPDAMEALRAGLAQLSLHDAGGHDLGLELIGACAVYAAAWHRLRQGLDPVEPDP